MLTFDQAISETAAHWAAVSFCRGIDEDDYAATATRAGLNVIMMTAAASPISKEPM
jgi:hypothetical protein